MAIGKGKGERGPGRTQLTRQLGNSYRGKLGRRVLNHARRTRQTRNRAGVYDGATTELAHACWTLQHLHFLLQHHTDGRFGVMEHTLGVRRLRVVVDFEGVISDGAADFSNLHEL